MQTDISPTQAADLVVVGSGGGGLCAAIAAHELGKRVVVVEKQAQLGGSTALSGGVLWIPNNPLMARAGVHDSLDRATQYLDSVVPADGIATAPERREMFLKAGPLMVQFLERLGLSLFWADGWSDYYDERPGGEPRGRSLMAAPFDLANLGVWAEKLATYAPFRNIPISACEGALLSQMRRTRAGKRAVGRLLVNYLRKVILRQRLVFNGAALQGRMLKLALDRNLPIMTSTRVTRLLLEGGRVQGVVVRHSDKEITLCAPQVLLCSGGFARNRELRQKLQRSPLSDTNANVGDTGEVLLEAMAHGAATEQLDAAWWVPTSKMVDGRWPDYAIGPGAQVFPPMHVFDLAKPHSILVDTDGHRYVNEAASYVELGEAMYRRNAVSGNSIPSWLIMDSRFLRYYGLATTPPGLTPRRWLKNGYLRRADDLPTLAESCGIAPQPLVETVERFNGFAAKGKDEDFHRGERQYDRWRGDPRVGPNCSLGPIAKPPFYAVAMFPGDVGTSGGLVTDEFARVIRTDGSVIDGLYATGNVTASVFGKTYPAAGASIAASFVFGYVAVHHMAHGSAPARRD